MTTTQGNQTSVQLKDGLRTILRGIGQVMFQCNAWTGLLFLAGIFWGSYECGLPQVAWGAVVGVFASTLAGYALGEPASDGDQGLWGFNGVLVGCAFPTFMPNNWLMWVSIIFFAALSTWVRRGFNNVMAPWKVNSLTFPFVFLTWVFLLACRMFDTMQPVGLSHPGIEEASGFALDCGFGHLVVYWLKGIAQVFLVNSWVTGIFFLAALFIGNVWAGVWGAVGSAISLALAILFKANGADIADGLYGFSPVLTGIAIGMTFYKVNLRSAAWAVLAIVATFFVQAAMDILMQAWGLPTLTGPFCVATWLFLLPLYKFTSDSPDHSDWKTKK